MPTKHEHQEYKTCQRAGCAYGKTPTIGPIRDSKGVKRQKLRVQIAAQRKKLNEEKFQNGSEWKR